MHSAWVWFVVGVALPACVVAAASGCSPEPEQVPQLRLVDLRPRERSSVYLNEPLVLHFSSELDRASVTPQSVKIATRGGAAARGARFVAGRELSFVPEPGLAPDLQDGGYSPNTTYVIELSGFPRADALRTTSGACLPATLRIEFHTVALSDPRTGFIFDDASPDHAKPLHVLLQQGSSVPPNRTRMYAETGLELEGEEPLDPSTLDCDAISLVKDLEGGGRLEYPLRPVLKSNYNKHAFPYQGTTILRLVPLARIPEDSGYRVSVDPAKVTFRDFSGHPVPVIGREALSQLRVRVFSGKAEDRAGEYLEEFLDTRMRSSLVVPGVDGTALWSNTGRLEVRFPAAAGDGSDGDVEFGARESRARLAALRLGVPAGVRTELDAGAGLCLLASQGAIDLDGDLTRLGAPVIAAFPEVLPGDTVSAWIARQENSGVDVTVIVAGGDLRIRGELSVPGPLLLVAGGRVLLSGRIRVAGAEAVGATFLGQSEASGAIALWSKREARGEGERQVARTVTAVSSAGLVIDPPRVNPLVRGLAYSVRSNPVPSEGRAARWLSADSTRGRAGGGSFRIRYAGERPAADAQSVVEVDDPTLLVDCSTLRLVLTLEVPAARGAPWDPPTIDTVCVRWETR